MLAKLHAAKATNTYEWQFNQLTKVDLIIDDFGLKPLRSPQDEDLYDIVSERYERRSIDFQINNFKKNGFLQ